MPHERGRAVPGHALDSNLSPMADPFEQALITDIESVSEADIKQCGAWVYSLHPSTDVYCVSFGWENEEHEFTWTPGKPMPPRVREFIRSGGVVVAHNAGFEHAVWRHVLVPRYGFEPVADDQWRDTQALSLAMGLPATLEGAAKVLGCPVQKDIDGAKLMRKMASAVEPDGSGGYVYPMATAEFVDPLCDYCETDVGSTRPVYRALKNKLSIHEHCVWAVDQKINRHGVFLDRAFARRCKALAEARKTAIDDDVFAVTTGELHKATDPHALKSWLIERGVKLPIVKRSNGKKSPTADVNAVKRLLESDLGDDVVRRVLELRVEASSATSLAKLDRVFTMTTSDGRLRNALQFCGAHTGRWASYGLQTHNFPKVLIDQGELELARCAVQCGDDEIMAVLWERPLKILSQLLRSVISAAPGHELIAADYSAIEARVVAWLAGQIDIVELFASGADVYTHAATKIGSDNRQLGKVCTLMLGFGAGAVRSRATFADWDISMTFAETRDVVRAWREANPAIVGFWNKLEDATHRAVRNPGLKIRVGRILVRCTRNKQCLLLQLPSGRSLRYWRPHLKAVTKKVPVVNDAGDVEYIEIESVELRFYTPGRDRSTMVVESTYGGKLVENVTQAVARDLLAAALIRVDAVGWPYQLVTHVHDSAAAEVPKGQGDVREFEWLLAQSPKWADGLPIAVEGYRDTRFRG